jgi:hypothetical protein
MSELYDNEMAPTAIMGCDKQNHGLCQFSPDGKLIALAHNNRLCVRDGSSFDIVKAFSCVETIEVSQTQFPNDTEVPSISFQPPHHCQLTFTPIRRNKLFQHIQWSPDTQ